MAPSIAAATHLLQSEEPAGCVSLSPRCIYRDLAQLSATDFQDKS